MAGVAARIAASRTAIASPFSPKLPVAYRRRIGHRVLCVASRAVDWPQLVDLHHGKALHPPLGLADDALLLVELQMRNALPRTHVPVASVDAPSPLPHLPR